MNHDGEEIIEEIILEHENSSNNQIIIQNLKNTSNKNTFESDSK